MSKEIVWFEDEDGAVTGYTEDELESLGWGEAIPKAMGGFVYAWDSFRRLPIPEAPYIVAAGILLQRSKAILYGDPKKGKSILSAQLGRCVALGEPFLGYTTHRSKVLLIQLEMSYAAMQSRMKQDCEGMFIGTTFSMKLDRPEGQAKLRRALDAVLPDLLILDPFFKIFSGDENKVQDVTLITDFLDDIIDAYQLSVLTVHHSKKPGAEGRSDTAFELRGSSHFIAWHESILSLLPKTSRSDGKALVLKFDDLRHATKPLESIEIVLDGRTLDFHPRGTSTPTSAVIEYLQKVGIAKLGEIIEHTQLTRSTANRVIEMLLKEGLVARAGKGHYKRTG